MNESPMADDVRSDAELIDELQSDHNVLGTLYDRHAGLVYGLAMRILQETDEARDLTQEIFLGLCDSHGYDATRGTLPAYLGSITRSRAIDRLRARTRHLRLLKQFSDAAEPGPPPATPHQEVASHQVRTRVHAALQSLSNQERKVLELAYYSDLSQVEIAERLDAPLGSVKSWARRGLLRLQERLEDVR